MLNALAPVFFIILLGYALRRSGFPGSGFWEYVERSTYYIFIPVLLLETLSQAEIAGRDALPMLAAILLSILLLAVLLLALRPLTSFRGPEFSSVFQGGLRMNSFIGLAGIAALAGDQGLVLAGVALMGMIPLLNILCVSAVLGFSGKGSAGWGAVWLELFRNPLILACLAGFGLSLLPFALPEVLMRIFELLGGAALPLGLLAVGAGLHVRTIRAHIGAIAASSAVKLLLYPGLTALWCSLFGVTGPALTVAILFSGVPTAMSTYILARQLGGDTELMAAIITLQTALSAATLPLVLYLWT